MARVQPADQGDADSTCKTSRNSLLVCLDDLNLEDKKGDVGDSDGEAAESRREHLLSVETVDVQAGLALEELFTILLLPDIIADPSIETPESLKVLFTEAAAGLAYDICLWLLCMRWQFTTAREIDRSWQLHSYAMDSRNQSHNRDAIIDRHIGLTSTPLDPHDGALLIDNAIVESNKKFQALAQKRGHKFEIFWAFVRLTDVLDSDNYAESVAEIGEFCLTYVGDNKFDPRSPLIRLCLAREGNIIERSFWEIQRMKQDGRMTTDSECCRAFPLIAAAYCGFRVQDELEEKMPRSYRIARAGHHPLAQNRRHFADFVHRLSSIGSPLRSHFFEMGHEAWWERLEEYRSYALEMCESIEAEERAGI